MDEISFESFGRTLVNQLSDRYKLTRSVIYKRIKDLDIQTERIGPHAYISDEQLALLDALHEFVQGGGTTAEFKFYRELDAEDKAS